MRQVPAPGCGRSAPALDTPDPGAPPHSGTQATRGRHSASLRRSRRLTLLYCYHVVRSIIRSAAHDAGCRGLRPSGRHMQSHMRCSAPRLSCTNTPPPLPHACTTMCTCSGGSRVLPYACTYLIPCFIKKSTLFMDSGSE